MCDLSTCNADFVIYGLFGANFGHLMFLMRRNCFGAEDDGYMQDVELLKSLVLENLNQRSKQSRKAIHAAEEGGKSLFERWFPLKLAQTIARMKKEELVESANAKLSGLRWLPNNFKVKARRNM
jgi:hypothetical protein